MRIGIVSVQWQVGMGVTITPAGNTEPKLLINHGSKSDVKNHTEVLKETMTCIVYQQTFRILIDFSYS